jgi:hypothetical protein
MKFFITKIFIYVTSFINGIFCYLIVSSSEGNLCHEYDDEIDSGFKDGFLCGAFI